MNFDIDMVFSNFDKFKSIEFGLKKDLALADKTTDAFKDMNKELKDTKSKLSAISSQKNAFEDLVSGTPLAKITQMNNKFSKLNNVFAKLGSGSGKKQLVNLFKNTIGGGLKALSSGISALLPALASLAAPILLVVGAIVTLKRMWDLNIGGMQTTFFKVFGKIKDMWAGMVIKFDKTLKKLSPLFKVVFGTIGNILLPILTAVGLAFDGIFAIVSPIVDAITEAVKPLTDMFDTTNNMSKRLEMTKKIWGGIFKVLGFITKIIVKGLLRPLTEVIKVVAKVAEGFLRLKKINEDISKKMFDTFKNTEFGQKLFERFEKIKEIIMVIWDIYKKIYGIKDDKQNESKAKGVSRERSFKAAATMMSGGEASNTTDNRNFTINSAGSIDKNNAVGILDVFKKQFSREERV